MSLSELLKAYCAENKITYLVLAARADISRSVLSRIVTEKRKPSLETAKKLSPFLEMTPEEILDSANDQITRDLIQQQAPSLFDNNHLNLGPTGFAIKQNFTGRRKERKEIVDWYSLTKIPILILISIYGAGCSCLAWISSRHDLCAKLIPSSDDDLDQVLYPQAVDTQLRFFWISFVDRKKTFEEVLKDCYNHYRLHRPELGYPLVNSLDKITSLLIHIFEETPTLIVLDGISHHLHDYSEDHNPNEALDFIEQLSILLNCRTIITTHVVPNDLSKLAGCKVMKVGPLPDKDAAKYLKRRGVKATESEIKDCVSKSIGNPLALEKIADELMHCPSIPGLKPPANSRLLKPIKDNFIKHLGVGAKNFASACFKYSLRNNKLLFTCNDIISDGSLQQPLPPERTVALNMGMLELKDNGLLGSDDGINFYLHPVYAEILSMEEMEAE